MTPKPNLLTLPNPHRDFIVDPYIPTREVMLIAGGSGSGKSTFASQMMVDLQNGLPFFGRRVIKPPVVGYLAFDRSEFGIRRTLERSIGDIPFPFYSVVTSKEFRAPSHKSAMNAIQHFRSLHPDTNFLTVDGIGMAFKGESGSLSGVAGFVHDLIADMHLSPSPFTINALHHMPKAKKDSGYTKPREKLHGSVAWAATCETCIIIDSNEDITDPGRTITVCPRQGAEMEFGYRFDGDGRLVSHEPDPSDVKINPKQKEYYSTITDMPLGIYPMKDLWDVADLLQIPNSTARIWIDKLIDTQTIIKKHGYGKYERGSFGG